MDAIVLKALTKDPDYRYQSADEMRLDIEACLDGQPVAATASMGAVGYGGGYGGYGADAPTTALPPQQDPGTAMLPPMRDDDGGYGYDERPDRRRQPKKNHTSTILLVVAGILVLVGAIFMGKALFSGNNSGDDKIPMVNFVGLSKADATSQATNASITIAWGDTVSCEDTNVKVNQVCTQDPAFASGGTIAKTDTVTLHLSKGLPQVNVPDVTNKTQDEATSELEGKGFKVEPKTKESTTADAGTVLSQDPKGGTQADKGATITITVAAEPSKITLPNVINTNVDDAKKLLSGKGFTNVQTQEQSSTSAQGTVIGQTPDGNADYSPDTQITLTVSSGQQQTAVPNVFGKTVSQARAILSASGFNNIQFANGSSSDDNAIVTSQDPAANTPETDPGSVPITLTTVDSNNNGGNNFIGGNNG